MLLVPCDQYTPEGVYHVNTKRCIYQTVRSCSNVRMGIQDIRRENLQYIVDAQGLSSASKQFGKPDRQINDMLKNRKSFGEDVARQLEENYAMHSPKGWLDIEDRVFYDGSKFGIKDDPKTNKSSNVKENERVYKTDDPKKQAIIEMLLAMNTESIDNIKSDGFSSRDTEQEADQHKESNGKKRNNSNK